MGNQVESLRKAGVRESAVAFTQRFKRSAVFWLRSEIEHSWFKRDTKLNILSPPELLEYTRLHGPDLRSGNEDLDPFIIMLGFTIQGPKCNKEIAIRVGCDQEDAIQNGIELTLGLVHFWMNASGRDRLSVVGFDMNVADSLWRNRAWDQLYAAGAIDENPRHGLNLDVVQTQRLYVQYCNQMDSIHRDLKRKRLAEREAEEREARRQRCARLLALGDADSGEE